MEEQDIVIGSVDYKGRPARRSSSGRWISAFFVIAAEVGEKFAYFGIYSNLMSYLTEQLGLPIATAAENVNTWGGITWLVPLLGAYVADSWLGRYRSVVFSSALYVLGLGLLTLSAELTSRRILKCKGNKNAVNSCSSSKYLEIFFFISLYLIALAQGGHKPSLQAFGADQFDGNDLEENKAKSSFFNWWYFCLSAGVTVTLVVVVYVQDNLSWTAGYGIPCGAIATSLLIFLLGSRTYRYNNTTDSQKNPFGSIFWVVVRAIKNRRISLDNVADEEAYSYCQTSHQFKWLNKALISQDNSKEETKKCSSKDVEDTKVLLRIVPVWITSLTYGLVFAQYSTFFTKQGSTMDRRITSDYKIPPATLQSFIGVSVIIIMPVYDRIFVPMARALTGKPSGITMLQRIGIGMVLSALSMVVAAIVEEKRLKTAEEHGLIYTPNAYVPMSIMWLVPQYVLCGLADVFALVGLQEFFYDQVPDELRSLGVAWYYSITGLGSLLSTTIVAIIDKATSGHREWFTSNLNQARLNYFYWLLAGLNIVGLLAFLYIASKYIYRQQSSNLVTDRG